MADGNCGVCNEPVPIENAQVMRREHGGLITSYHMGCEHKAGTIKPCEDCGLRKLLCSECKE